jgi:hypothetical protein
MLDNQQRQRHDVPDGQPYDDATNVPWAFTLGKPQPLPKRMRDKQDVGKQDGWTVEVAHEALFRAWARFKGWLEAERARLEVMRLLEAASATWERHGRAAAFLDHRGTRLEDASDLEKHSHYSTRLITHLAFYAGWPAAMTAALVAKQVFEGR